MFSVRKITSYMNQSELADFYYYHLENFERKYGKHSERNHNRLMSYFSAKEEEHNDAIRNSRDYIVNDD